MDCKLNNECCVKNVSGMLHRVAYSTTHKQSCWKPKRYFFLWNSTSHYAQNWIMQLHVLWVIASTDEISSWVVHNGIEEFAVWVTGTVLLPEWVMEGEFNEINGGSSIDDDQTWVSHRLRQCICVKFHRRGHNEQPTYRDNGQWGMLWG